MARKAKAQPAKKKRGRPRMRPLEPGDPELSRSYKLPGSLWAQLRDLALRRGTTATEELRIALEKHLRVRRR
jgi:hypothetical protein